MNQAFFGAVLFVLPVVAAACGPSASPPRAPEEAAAPAPVTAATAEPTTAVAEDDASGPQCEVVCEGAQIATLKGGAVSVGDAESHTVAETENANTVLAGKNEDFVRCYKPRARVAPSTQGSVTFDVLIGPDGRVMKVAASGGDKLGPVKDCMMKVIQGSEFAPPHGGGTLNLQVPFTLRVQGTDEST